MRGLVVFLALVLAGCVAPVGAAPASMDPASMAPASSAPPDCSIQQPRSHDTPSGRQLTVDGQGFLNNEIIDLTVDIPGEATFTDRVQATNLGTFETEIRAGPDGRYTIGPARGLVCVAPAVFIVLEPTATAAPTPKPTAKPTPQPTVPPLPQMTLPPTDTE